MNKKIPLIAAAVIAVFAAGIIGYFMTAKPTIAPAQNSQSSLTAEAPITSEAVNECDQRNLPPGSYTKDGVGCIPTEQHQDRVAKIARGEKNSGDETQNSYITNVYEKAGSIYIDADYFQFLTSGNGGCVWEDSTAAPAANSANPTCNPNGFAIVNDSKQIRTLKLSPDAKIRLLEDFHTIPDLNALSPAEFMNGRNTVGQRFYYYEADKPADRSYTPFELILKDGEVKYIYQKYLP